MWRDAGMQITIKIEAGLQFSAKGGSARQIAHIFCRQQFARLNVQFLPTMFQHSRTDLKCNQPLIDMEVDVPPSNSAQTPPISHFTSLEWSPALFQCSLQCSALVPSVTEPVYDFEMVTKSQFHPRWATVMVLSGDCSSPKTEQKLGQTFIGVLIQTFITHLIAPSSKLCSLQRQGNANNSYNYWCQKLDCKCLQIQQSFHIVVISACVGQQQPSFVSQL